MRLLMVMSSTFDPPASASARLAQLTAFAAPYYRFLDAGLEIALASPQGGAPPIAWPPSADAVSPVVVRYREDRYTRDLLSDTLPLGEIYPEDFDLAFYPGDYPGNVAAIRELATNAHSKALITALWSRAPLGFVGSAVAALLNVEAPPGELLLEGRRVTGATPGEQRALVGLADETPFLEQQLRARHALYSRGEDWAVNVIEDGDLITGQNAQSADLTAAALMSRARNR
ncbi:MAG: type 1 glutamine amidotransferase domain-containing protein [Caulobacter sp.]|nr:type 1 glutamine amidotransferase domain-containing protein [Caulobacter sp.]